MVVENTVFRHQEAGKVQTYSLNSTTAIVRVRAEEPTVRLFEKHRKRYNSPPFTTLTASFSRAAKHQQSFSDVFSQDWTY